jgi:hypothetical protein
LHLPQVFNRDGFFLGHGASLRRLLLRGVFSDVKCGL